MKKIVDISGYGHSGKTVVTDYLKQFDCVFTFPNHVEFELFRVPGGLLDLYTAVYQPYNLIRSRIRLNEFKQLVRRIGTVQSFSNPSSYWTASGHGYDSLFNNKFIEISDAFLSKLISGKQITFWPYENLKVGPVRLFGNKLKGKLFKSLLSATIYYTHRDEFLPLTQNYIQSLFSEVMNEGQSHVLLSNAFEPFDPTPSLDIAGNAFSIIVDRDPRDIYASLINVKGNFIPDNEKYKKNENIKKQMTGFGDIEQFIFRYKAIKQNVLIKSKQEDNRILRIRYEDFVLNHEKTAQGVREFIGLPDTARQIGKIYFDPERSKVNIGVWKQYTHLKEIQLISKELAEYCYQ